MRAGIAKTVPFVARRSHNVATNGFHNQKPFRPTPNSPWRVRTHAERGRGRPVTSTRDPIDGLATTQSSQVLRRSRARASSNTDTSLVRFLLRWSWIVVITTVLGLAGAYGYLMYGPLKYRSTSLLVVRPQADTSGEPLLFTNPSRMSATALALAGQAATPPVFDAASRALAGQLAISSDEISALVMNGRITVNPLGTSSLISVEAVDSDPRRAWLLADGYGRGFMEYLGVQSRLVAQQQRAQVQAQIDVLQQQLAALPSGMTSPAANSMFNSSQSNVFDSLVQAQARMLLLSQAEIPVTRQGDTFVPVRTVTDQRVLVAGAAAGALAGLCFAYLLELLRQWRMSRPARKHTTPNAERTSMELPMYQPGPGAAAALAGPARQHRPGQPQWAD
jgi:hypothetical protein